MISIKNQRIIDFTNKFPNFDIEQTLITFIDFIEQTCNTLPSLNTSLATQILDNLKLINNNVNLLPLNLKKDYIDDLKSALTINNTNSILPIVKEYNESFINKISLMLPEEQKNNNNYLQNIFKNLENSIVIELNKGITQQSIDTLVHNIEQKFSCILSNSGQLLNVVNDNKSQESKINEKIEIMLNKLGKNNEKGKISENILEFNLQEIYPLAEIRNVSQQPHSGDFWIVRKDKPIILVENKNHDSTVYSDDVQKFIDDINTHNMSGIMISQNSNIVYRENYEIEIYNGNIAVYINYGNYDAYKIKIAVQIIDTFKTKIQQQVIENGNNITIDKYDLEKINKQFQLWNTKKSQHLTEIKNCYETLIKSAEEMELSALDEMLEANGLLTGVKKFVCENCPRTFPTLKGRDTHQRVCEAKCEFICNICNEPAKTKKGLESHKKKKH